MSQDPMGSDGISLKEDEFSKCKNECVFISSDESGDEYAVIEKVDGKGETDDSNTSEECASTREIEWENIYEDDVIIVKDEIAELNGPEHEDTLEDAKTRQLQHNAEKNISGKTFVPHSTVNGINLNNNKVAAIMQKSCKVVAAYLLNKSLKRTRLFNIHPDNADRLSRGEFNFFTELCEDEKKFFEYFKMSVKTFEEIHARLEPHLKRCDLHKAVVCPKERLAITIRYLTTSAGMSQLSRKYKLGTSTIKDIIEQVCVKIWEILKDEFLPDPNLNWQNTAQGFEKNANFPNCIGAMGVKCTQIACPVEDLPEIVCKPVIILAMCDTNYRFTYIDIACGGKAFEKCSANMLSHLKMPPAKVLPETSKPVPYIIVADDACAVSVTILRPYFIQASEIPKVNRKTTKTAPCTQSIASLSGSTFSPKISRIAPDTPDAKLTLFGKKIFNYRLNRALRYIESTLAIMTNKFSIFERPIKMSHSFAEVILKAIFVLHNFVIQSEGYTDEDTMIQLGLTDHKDNRHLRTGNTLRDHYANYFVAEGAVPWQNYIYL